MRRLLCLLYLLPVPAAAGPIIHYEGGITVASGDYAMSERTTSVSWMTGLALERGRVTARASVPVWFQNSTSVSMTGGGPVPSGDGQTGRDTTTTTPRGRYDPGTQDTQGFSVALGDPVLQLSLRVLDRLEAHGAARCQRLPDLEWMEAQVAGTRATAARTCLGRRSGVVPHRLVAVGLRRGSREGARGV